LESIGGILVILVVKWVDIVRELFISPANHHCGIGTFNGCYLGFPMLFGPNIVGILTSSLNSRLGTGCATGHNSATSYDIGYFRAADVLGIVLGVENTMMAWHDDGMSR
jgi:hypothetical protein